MSTKLKAYLGSTFIVRYSLPENLILTGYDGKFVIYSGIGGYTILTVTTTPNANGSFVTIGTNWVQVQIGAADLALVQAAPDVPDQLQFAFDFFLSAGGVVTKLHGGPLSLMPVGSSNSSNFEELTVSLGEVTYSIAVDSGFSYAYLSSPDMSLPAEVAARIAGDENLQQQITGVSTSLDTGLNQVNASIVSESGARASADSALAYEITTLTASFSGVSDLAGQVATNTAAISNEATVRANADSAISSTVTTLSATVSGYSSAISANTAAITAEQTARANGDSANASAITSLSATVSGYSGSIAANTAAISTEATARASADSAMATDITNLSATVSGNTAAISNEATARANADSAISSTVSSLSSTVSSNTAAISNEATARANGDSANATDISNLSATVGVHGGAIAANTAAISTEQTARANGDSANASSISSLSSTVGGLSSTVSTVQSTQASQSGTIATLSAQWSVTLDVNGYVTGIYQQSTGTSSNFTIQTGNFQIVGVGGAPFIPFTVDTVNNIVKMTNVYIDSLIAGSVTTPALANNATTTIANASYSGPLYGFGSYYAAISFNITLSSACWVYVDAVAIQGFHAGTGWNWGVQLLVNGNSSAGSTVTGTVQNSSINVKNAQYLGAGTYTIQLQWKGDSNMTLDQAAAFAVGYLKTT